MLAISQKIPIHEFIVSQKNIEEGSESDGESDGEYNVELEVTQELLLQNSIIFL